MKRLSRIGALMGALMALGAAPALAAPPPNDNFAAAQTAPVGTTAGTNVEATLESGEPTAASPSTTKTVWYTFTPAATGSYTLDTCGTTLDTVLAVYSGAALTALTQVGTSDDGCGTGGGSRVTVALTAGAAYKVQVGGFNMASGAFSLAITAPPPPANDNFAGAQTAGVGTTAGTNVSATLEAGEPEAFAAHTGKTVWYTFTPASSGAYAIDTCGTALDTVLGVYSGTTLGGLTKLGGADEGCAGGGNGSKVIVGLTAGTAYKLQVGGYYVSTPAGAASGAFSLAIAGVTPPANDGFAAATVLTGSTPSAAYDTTFATKEAGEPNHVGFAGGASVWYTWTPAVSGNVVANCSATTGTVNLLAVYTGGAVNALTEVASGLCRVPFAVQAGTTYRIALDGQNGFGDVSRGTGTLQITQGGVTASPAPLDFGSQEVFTLGATRTVTITNGTAYTATLFGSPVAQGANVDDVVVLSSGTCTSGATLAAGATCTVRLKFSPEATGPRTANLFVPYRLDAFRTSSTSIALTGTGTAATGGPQGPAGAAGSNGADGSAGPTGPAGPAGPTGKNGTNGATGAPGATGARGPAGRDARVTCKVAKQKARKVKVTCKVRLAAASSSRVTARLIRHGRVVRTTRVSARRGRARVRLAALGLRHGAYTVLLSSRRAGKVRVTRTRIRIL